MKTLLGLLGAFLFTSCTAVSVKQIAGDGMPKLDHPIEGTWLGEDGVRCTIRLKDEARRIYELTPLNEEKEEPWFIAVRQLKDRLVVTMVEGNGRVGEEAAPFLRMSLAEDSMVFFAPRAERFHEAVIARRIAGTHREAAKDGQTVHPASSVLDQFTKAEVDAMDLPLKGNVLECFEPDPGMVLIREKQEKSKR